MNRWLAIVLLFVTSHCIATADEPKAYDIVALYKLALKSDPTLQAAKAEQLATMEAMPQARALLLPNLQAVAESAGTSSSRLGNFNTNGYSIQLRQPLYNPANWVTFSQSRDTVKAAIASYNAAEQDLIIRLAEQYFNVLAAKDDLDFARSQRIAFTRFLEQTEQRFNVGLIAITDVHEAQARRDSAYADEIAAENVLADQYELLRTIIGEKVTKVKTLRKEISLDPPTPKNIDDWVNAAVDNNFSLLALRHQLDSSKKQIKRELVGHLPTVEFTANLDRFRNPPPIGTFTRSRDFGVNLSLPIFAGGNVISRTREARYNYDQSDREYEAAYRDLISNTRQAYRGILTRISQVGALKQAVVSNESSLKAIKAAFDVGTRTSVDVLNAQSELLAAERNYKGARYDYLIEGLRLKRAAGNLIEEDLLKINGFIK